MLETMGSGKREVKKIIIIVHCFGLGHRDHVTDRQLLCPPCSPPPTDLYPLLKTLQKRARGEPPQGSWIRSKISSKSMRASISLFLSWKASTLLAPRPKAQPMTHSSSSSSRLTTPSVLAAWLTTPSTIARSEHLS